VGGIEHAVDIRFQLLGPVQVVVDGDAVPIGGAGSRGLLAILALHVNRPVSLEYLIDTLWTHDPPASARTIVHGNVSALRRALRRAQQGTGHHTGDQALVETTTLGYRLVVAAPSIDVFRARALLDQALPMPAPQRAELLHEAVGLWQGAPLSGAPDSIPTTDLRELWRAVHEARIDADLELGRHAELVGELSRVVEDDPTVERAVAQLMRALYYSGRRGEALEIYRRAARRMSTELGIDPGPGLATLHERMLRDDMPEQLGAQPGCHGTAAGDSGAVETPFQLPAAVPNLAGRKSDLSWLTAMREAAQRGVATVAVLSGTAGVGKSALTISWAHGVAAEFPDGVLFASLHGSDPAHPPPEPGDVLNQFLRGLGVSTTELPDTVHERVALYRSLLAERTVLILLDDAADSGQVEPLLPPGAHCMTVVTSRRRMDDLVVSHAARHRVVGVLDPASAAQLVAELAGPDPRGRSERIAELCGFLPLALRLAGARLAAQPHWNADDLVRELSDERTRLAALDVAGADTSVHAALDVSYRGLSNELALVLRCIGVLNVYSIGPHHVATLCDIAVPTARNRLRLLAAQHLLTETSRDVFTAHDLVRLYVRDLAELSLTGDERDAVVAASLRFYLAAGDTARRRLLRIVDSLYFTDTLPGAALPVFDTTEKAAAWFEREWDNILTTLAHAIDVERCDQAWQLARVAHTYRVVHPWWEQWDRLIELGLRAAEWAQSAIGSYWLRLSSCSAGLLFDLAERSRVDGEEAVRLAAELDEDRLAISANIHLGCALQLCGRPDEAVETLHKTLADTERLADPALHGQTLNNCAEAEKRAGRIDDAIQHQSEALEIDRMLGDDGYIAVSLNNLAELYLLAGDLDLAAGYSRQAVELAATHQFTLQEGVFRHTLGSVLRAAGYPEQAGEQLRIAVERHERVGATGIEPIRRELGSLYRNNDLADT